MTLAFGDIVRQARPDQRVRVRFRGRRGQLVRLATARGNEPSDGRFLLRTRAHYPAGPDLGLPLFLRPGSPARDTYGPYGCCGLGRTPLNPGERMLLLPLRSGTWRAGTPVRHDVIVDGTPQTFTTSEPGETLVAPLDLSGHPRYELTASDVDMSGPWHLAVIPRAGDERLAEAAGDTHLLTRRTRGPSYVGCAMTSDSPDGPDGPRPARPHERFTEDGRRMREVLSYSRRGSRFTPSQAAAWERYADRWVIPEEAVDHPDFDLGAWFGREAPVIVEIGPGVGEATGVLAAARPDHDVLALEVWRPGVARALAEVAAAGATNVRFCGVDATWVLRHVLGEESLAELWTFFPDPWPKKRHNKRRLVDADFARLAATRLRRGASWRLATDWVDYAVRMRQVLDGEPLLEGGVVDRWAARPVTKFERKGRAAGREITDLAYVRG